MADDIEPLSWDMRDWPTEEKTVGGLVMAVEGCGNDDDRLQLVGEDGTSIELCGVTRHNGVVCVVVRAAPVPSNPEPREVTDITWRTIIAAGISADKVTRNPVATWTYADGDLMICFGEAATEAGRAAGGWNIAVYLRGPGEDEWPAGPGTQTWEPSAAGALAFITSRIRLAADAK